MSKRNLETIVEAIRHLEGDNIMCDLWKDSSSRPSSHINIPVQSEESQPESSSDAEDFRSESSGRDSPLCPPTAPCPVAAVTSSRQAQPASTLRVTQVSQVPVANMVPVAAPAVAIVDKWNLLPRPAGIVSRPGVIVQKSS